MKCQRCPQIAEESETCEVCHRVVCDKCGDKGSGMCSDCAKAVFLNPERFLLCCDEDFIEKELLNRLKEVDEADYETEIERQEAFDRVQEQINQHRNEVFERFVKQRPITTCSDCNSDNIRLYPDFFMGFYRFNCRCLDCGAKWTSEQRRL